MNKESKKQSKKPKLKLIHGNPKAHSNKVPQKINNEPFYIKAAVMGSKRPDIALYDEKESKFNNAIEKYRRLVNDNPDNLQMINTLGDLCIRAGKTDEAIYNFKIIADSFYKSNNWVKALAIYKKISKICPYDIRIENIISELRKKLNMK